MADAQPQPRPDGITINGADARQLAEKIHDGIIAAATAHGVPDDMDGCVRMAHALGVIIRIWQSAVAADDYGTLTAAFATGFHGQVKRSDGTTLRPSSMRLVHTAPGHG